MILSDSTPENFANIWQIKWNWIRSIKFETVQIHFLSEFSVRLSSRNFATTGTWRNDSSLFYKGDKSTVTSLRIHIYDKNDLNMVMYLTLRQRRRQSRILRLSQSNIDVKEVGHLMTPTQRMISALHPRESGAPYLRKFGNPSRPSIHPRNFGNRVTVRPSDRPSVRTTGIPM